MAFSEQVKDSFKEIQEKWTYLDICCAMEALSDMSMIQQVYTAEHYNKKK